MDAEDYTQLRQLLRELVATETNAVQVENFDQISYSVKQALQMGKEEAFSQQLSYYAAKKDADIEKLCSANYQAIDQILKVKSGTSSMTEEIGKLREFMDESGNSIVEKKQLIVDNRGILLNIENALEVIQSCLFVLDIYSKVYAQIDNGKYYSALRLLQELRDVHIQLISNFNFAADLVNAIPKLQLKVKEHVLDEMKDCIKENTRMYGKEAMNNTTLKQERIQSRAMYNRSSSVNVNVALEIAMAEENDNELEDPQNKIDFKPLYQCLLIHQFLGEKEQLQAEYEEIRKIQANLLLGTVVSFKAAVPQSSSEMGSFEEFLQEVVGFFMVEAAVMGSTENFRSRGVVDILWDNAVDKINGIIANALKDASDSGTYLNMKNIVVNFTQTIEVYGFVITKLRDTLASLFDTFTELMKGHCSAEILRVLDEDDLKPLVINNPQEMAQVNESFKFSDKQLGTRYPKQLSCTRGFIQTCAQIKSFISQFYKFADGFTQQNNEMDDLLKKSVDNLIVQTVSSGLVQKFDTTDIGQIIQIIINLEYFQLACVELEHILSDNKFSHKGSRVTLQARELLKNAMKTGEKRIIEVVGEAVAEIVSNSGFNWVNTVASLEPSQFVKDIDKYMRTTVSHAIAQLSMDFRNQLYSKTSTEFAKTCLVLFSFNKKSMLNSNSIKKMTSQSIQIFYQDVLYLERSLAEQSSEVTFAQIFTELKQTLEYLKNELYEEILNQSVKDKKYPLAQIQTIVAVLEKLKPDAGLFATAAEKTKRKNIENVIKGLVSPGSS